MYLVGVGFQHPLCIADQEKIIDIMGMEKFQAYSTRVDEAIEQEKELAAASSAQGRDADEVDAETHEPEDGSDKDLVDAVGKEAAKLISDEVKDEITKYKKEAARQVSALRLLTEPKTSAAMTNELKAVLDEIGKVQKTDETASAKITVVMYDVLLSGESVTNPKTRKPPLRSHLQKMMSSTLAINGGKELDENFVYMLFNGGKEGVQRQQELAPVTVPFLGPPS